MIGSKMEFYSHICIPWIMRLWSKVDRSRPDNQSGGNVPWFLLQAIPHWLGQYPCIWCVVKVKNNQYPIPHSPLC